MKAETKIALGVSIVAIITAAIMLVAAVILTSGSAEAKTELKVTHISKRGEI